MRCRVYVTVEGPSVRLSICAAAWARAADIDRQLTAPFIDYRSIAAGARAAAAGSVMLRAEVRGLHRPVRSSYEINYELLITRDVNSRDEGNASFLAVTDLRSFI